jgi:FtsP/CotA-like multicopper oxidase with cupredoxin domain
MEFRIVANPAYPDKSVVPGFTETYPYGVTPPATPTLIPNPDLSQIPLANERTFEFDRGANQTSLNKDTSFTGPWGISTNSGGQLAADYGRISAAPKPGTREIWHLNNGGGGWDHPIHIHFEEGQVLDRDGLSSNVPLWERGRKDVYRLRAAGTLTITMQFRDFAGTYMEHCHNTVHEDNAMLLRWDINGELQPLPTPVPTPQGVNFIDPDEVLPGA